MAEKLWKGVPQSPFVPKPYQKQVLKTQEEEKKKTSGQVFCIQKPTSNILINFATTESRRTVKSPCFSRSENKILRFLDCYWDHEVNYQPPAEIIVINICAVRFKILSLHLITELTIQTNKEKSFLDIKETRK